MPTRLPASARPPARPPTYLPTHPEAPSRAAARGPRPAGASPGRRSQPVLQGRWQMQRGGRALQAEAEGWLHTRQLYVRRLESRQEHPDLLLSGHGCMLHGQWPTVHPVIRKCEAAAVRCCDGGWRLGLCCVLSLLLPHTMLHHMAPCKSAHLDAACAPGPGEQSPQAR